MGQIILVRHGQAAFGEAEYDTLTPLGQKQAIETGNHLRGTLTEIHHAFSGEMIRQKESAALALEPRAPEVNSAFNEFDHLAVIAAAHPILKKSDPELVRAMEENFSNRTFQPFFNKAVDLWIDGMPLNGETYQAFASRVLKGLEQVSGRLGKGGNAAVFSSGGAISVMAAHVMGLGLEKALNLSWTLRNGSITTLLKGRQGLSLLDFGCTAHLAVRDTELLTFR